MKDFFSFIHCFAPDVILSSHWNLLTSKEVPTDLRTNTSFLSLSEPDTLRLMSFIHPAQSQSAVHRCPSPRLLSQSWCDAAEVWLAAAVEQVWQTDGASDPRPVTFYMHVLIKEKRFPLQVISGLLGVL